MNLYKLLQQIILVLTEFDIWRMLIGLYMTVS